MRAATPAQQIDGKFTMLVGSNSVADWYGVGKADSTIRALQSYGPQHLKLTADGSIVMADGIGTLAKDIVSGSPSTAGANAQGRSCNGRISWISYDGNEFLVVGELKGSLGKPEEALEEARKPVEDDLLLERVRISGGES